MRLINLERGLEILLCSGEELRPLSGIHLVDFVSATQERYQFLNAPDLSRPAHEIHANPYKFAEGKVAINGTAILIQEFNIFRDGIVVRSPHTDSCELIMNDALEWARHEFGLRDFITQPVRRFSSSIVVDFNKNIDGLIGVHERLSAIISNCLKQHRGVDLPLHAQRLAYAVDATKLLTGTVAEPFVIERRADAPYEQNRFFCDAPLPTQAHLDLLEQIEALAD